MPATIDQRRRKLDGERQAHEQRMTWAASLYADANDLRYRSALERRRGATEAAADLERRATLAERQAEEWEQFAE